MLQMSNIETQRTKRQICGRDKWKSAAPALVTDAGVGLDRPYLSNRSVLIASKAFCPLALNSTPEPCILYSRRLSYTCNEAIATRRHVALIVRFTSVLVTQLML